MDLRNDSLESVNEVNLAWLLLVQRLLRADKAMGMFHLGISAEIADIVVGLTMEQTVKLAKSSQLLCRLRFDDHAVLSALVDRNARRAHTAMLHKAVLLAGQPAEEFK